MSLYHNLSEEQVIFRDSIRRFAEEYITPIAQELDEKEEFSIELTKKFAEFGFLGTFLPSEYGGLALDYLSYILLVEEIARVDVSQALTIAAHNSYGIAPIYHFGNAEQKSKYLPQLAIGKLWSLGYSECNYSADIRNVDTVAEKSEDNHWVLNGSKVFVSNAATELSIGATVIAGSANRLDKKTKRQITEYSLFLIEKGAPGYRAAPVKNRSALRASNIATIDLDECKIPAENLLGQEAEGNALLQKCLDNGRLAYSAIGLGLAQAAFDYALKFANNHKYSGKTVSTNQSIAFKLADIQVGIELARTYLYDACRLVEIGENVSMRSTVARLYCSELAQLAVEHCIHIVGINGLMKDSKIERFYRNQRALQIIEGSSDFNRSSIASMLGCFDKLNFEVKESKKV